MSAWDTLGPQFDHVQAVVHEPVEEYPTASRYGYSWADKGAAGRKVRDSHQYVSGLHDATERYSN